jgi:hypothetical protein
MKRRALALTVILALLSSAVAGILLVNLAKANYFPPPSIEIFSPFPAPVVYSNASVPLDVRVNILPSEPDITYIRYSLDGKANVTLTNLAKEENVGYWTSTKGVIASGTAFSAQVSMDNLADGKHTLIVYAHYANGKEMSRSREFTVDTHYKPYTPELAILSPQNQTYTTTEVPLIWTCDEQKIVADYTLDLLSHIPLYAYFTLSENASLPGNTTLTDLSNGTHTLTVYVITERGTASQTVHFTVSPETQPEPFPTTLVIATVALVAVIGIGLIVYFKKRKKESEDKT